MSQSDEVSSPTMFGVPNTPKTNDVASACGTEHADGVRRAQHRPPVSHLVAGCVGRSKHREDVRMHSGVSSSFGMPNRAEIHPRLVLQGLRLRAARQMFVMPNAEVLFGFE